jgi:hypothetical protein
MITHCLQSGTSLLNIICHFAHFEKDYRGTGKYEPQVTLFINFHENRLILAQDTRKRFNEARLQ